MTTTKKQLNLRKTTGSFSPVRPTAFTLLAMMVSAPLRAASFDADVRAMTSQDGVAAADAQDRLSRGGGDAITALVKDFANETPRGKERILYTIAKIREEGRSVIARDADVVELARLGRIEKDVPMRTKVANALYDLGGSAAIKELERFASEDSDEWLRRGATFGVGDLAPNELMFFRKQAQKDSSRWVRLTAYARLAEAGDRSGRDLALTTLKDPKATDNEKNEAVLIVGEVGNPNDTALLNELVTTQSPYVRDHVKRSLKTLELLQHPEGERLDLLFRSLDDPSMVVREWASMRLIHSKDPTTSARLSVYLAAPGHVGYKEAMAALRRR
jgi:HEAT repeat protein